ESMCTDNWTGASGSTWQTPSNWSTGLVPGVSDIACIESGITVQVTGGTNQTGSLRDEGTLTVSGGTLELANGLETSNVSTLTLSGGTLSLAQQLDVNSSLSSNGSATVSGAGRLVVKTGASGAIDAASCSLLTLAGGVTLVNNGTVTVGLSGGSSGQLDMQEGAQLQNTGTFNADSYAAGCVPGSNAAAIQNNGGTAPSVTNTGTFNVAPGANTLNINLPFNNEGTVNIASGTLTPTGGGSSSAGTWTTATGTTVSFTSGSYSLINAEASGAKFALSGGTLSVPSGTSTVGTLSLTGGTLSVAGELDVNSSMSSSGNATVTGAGRLVVKTGATGSVDSAACSLLTLAGVTLVNNGTVTVGLSGGSSGQIDMQEGAQLQNAGTFNADSYAAGCVPGSNAATILNNGGTAPSVTNTGTFNTAPGSANTMNVNVPFKNEGTVNGKSGTLQMSGGGNSIGAWAIGSGATLAFSAGSFSLTGGTLSGAIGVNGGAVSATSVEGAGANISVSSGTLTIPTGTVEVSALSLTGGTVSVGGEFDVNSSWSSSGNAMVSGVGRLVVKTGASGTIDAANCSLLTLAGGVTLVNDGSVTFGLSGGSSG